MLTLHVLLLMMRTLIMYGTVFLMLRIMGKREIGQLSIFDLVIFIMIAEVAVIVMEDVERPIFDGIIPIITLVLVQITIALFSLKSRKLRMLIDGQPSLLISKGKINREEMRRQRYNLDDLLMQLRSKNIDSVADVEFAILETSGKLSVFPRTYESPKEEGETTDKDKNLPHTVQEIKVKYESLPVPLIMDGKVQDNNLEKIGKTRFWLKNQIQSKGHRDFKEVFLCSIDHKGRLYIDGGSRST
ncbi:DUF421 domain-containing protein [Paenibacillus sp. CAA11]|uniref:DUF421 domain-containing protein n=1 Tax=Paenibacillus sp. CAA11 TaxID=1532905 RepID=UPI000D395011|nr:DUF421 domain-containing protein [Paenibacillus sp. CAA11]AWB45698.1 DUF421 domain-containing protein [Paenibacillus sp. CAA11]